MSFSLALRTGAVAVVLFPFGLAPLLAQEQPAAPVRVTRAISAEVRRAVELSGSVEARRSSLVATEVAGLVIKIFAREGDQVKAGQPLLRLKQVSVNLRLRAREGEVGEARSRLALARSAHERAVGLFEEELISVEQLDNAVSELAAWQGRVAQLEAELDLLKAELNVTVVRAPFAGVIASEHVSEGEWIDAGGTTFELVDTENLELALEVPEALVSGLEPGELVTIVFDALEALEMGGIVRAVVPRADPQSRTFPVKVDLPNPDRRIGVGMLARARLAAGDPETAVLVPKDALVSQGTSRKVFRVDENGKAESVPVTTGSAEGLWIAVEGGLQAGDTVIIRGNERLQAGQEVIQEPLEVPRSPQ